MIWVRRGYLFAEFLVLYAICVGVVWMFFPTIENEFVTLLVFGVVALAMIPFCIGCVTFGLNYRNNISTMILTGAYDPVRPIALAKSVANFYSADSDEGPVRGKGTVLCFDGVGGVTALDVVDRLVSQLKQQGIQHRYIGELSVDDGGTRWGVDPDLSEPRLTVWVDSPNRSYREQIVAAVQDVIVNDLNQRIV